MYHGVTGNTYDPPAWTQLPKSIFVNQIKFLKKYYQPVSLQQVIAAISGGEALPQNAVLITFDDGLRNNATVAWPILQKFETPATIFLTVDFIDTDRFFWVDELYLNLVEARRSKVGLALKGYPEALRLFNNGDTWGAYLILVESMKRLSEEQRKLYLGEIESRVKFNRNRYSEDFGMLSWKQVERMFQSGLIDYGVHTATHQILTGLDSNQFEKEIVIPRQTLESKLKTPVTSFCYPNGRKGIDFVDEHELILRQNGYDCAFTTNRSLFRVREDNPMAIGRMPAGYDLTSYPEWFRLSISRG